MSRSLPVWHRIVSRLRGKASGFYECSNRVTTGEKGLEKLGNLRLGPDSAPPSLCASPRPWFRSETKEYTSWPTRSFSLGVETGDLIFKIPFSW